MATRKKKTSRNYAAETISKFLELKDIRSRLEIAETEYLQIALKRGAENVPVELCEKCDGLYKLTLNLRKEVCVLLKKAKKPTSKKKK